MQNEWDWIDNTQVTVSLQRLKMLAQLAEGYYERDADAKSAANSCLELRKENAELKEQIKELKAKAVLKRIKNAANETGNSYFQVEKDKIDHDNPDDNAYTKKGNK
jgi:hypothetical protein